MKNSKGKFFFKENPERILAIQVLSEIFKNKQSQAILDRALHQSSLSSKDKALTTELVYGSLRYYVRLEYILSLCLSKPDKLPKELYFALIIASYEIIFLNSIPHYATVNSIVNYVKSQYGLKLANLTNAVLHKIIDFGIDVNQINFYKNHAAFYSVPQWLYGYFNKNYDEEITHLILKRSLQRPLSAIRLNQKSPYFSELDNFLMNSNAEQIHRNGYVFPAGQSPKLMANMDLQTLMNKGAFSWQAAGSQMALQFCLEKNPSLKNYPLWDLCAGQGGKTTALLEIDVNVTIASDYFFPRLLLLKNNIRRLNLNSPQIICANSVTNFFKTDFLDNFYGNILLDVPCSGFGTLARRPEIRFFRTYDDVQKLIILQEEILSNAFHLLRVGHIIIYMTCTLNPHENELQVLKLLSKEKNAECIFSWQTPHDHPYLEGMYVAIILKK